MSASRSDLVQHLYTVTPNAAPPANWLKVGEIGIELADPAKLWVGVPTDMDATGRKLLFNAANISGGPWLPLTGGTLAGPGNLTVNGATTLGAAGNTATVLVGAPANTTLAILNFQAVGTKQINFQQGTSTRWRLQSAGTESGSNAGSNLTLAAYGDTGGQLSNVFSITRATGLATVAGDPTAALGIATKQYIDARAFTDAPNDAWWYGRHALAWSRVPGLTQVSAGSGFDLNTITGTGGGPFTSYIGLHQIGNQTGGLNFPGSQTTGLILSGFNSNAGWNSQLFMGAMAALPQLYYRASSAQGTYGAWYQIVTTAGATLTGMLTLASDPTAALHAATKQYVDTHVAVGGPFLPLTGGVLSGNLGVGMALPAALLGSAFAATQFSSTNTGTNIYYDGTNWRFLIGSAGGGVIGTNPASYGGLIFYTAGLGASAGALATLSNTMILNPGGMAVTGVLSATGTLSSSAGIISNGNYVGLASGAFMQSDATYTYLRMDTGGWGWVYTRSSGLMQYQRGYDYTMLFSIDPGGNASCTGQFSAGGQVNAPSFNASGGTFYVASNPAYYLGRSGSDGYWRFVENGTNNFQIGPGGDIYGRNTLMMASGFYPDASGNWRIFSDGSSRQIQWSPSWNWWWTIASGISGYSTPGGSQWIFSNDWTSINWLQYVGGNGAYVNVSDERTKVDIAEAPHGLDHILALRPITFRRVHAKTKKRHDRTELGFSAQQLRDILPEAVVSMNAPEEWRHVADSLMGMAVEPVVAALVNAIKTLNARLATLEAKGTA